MNGKRIYALLSDVDDDLITDADISDRLPAAGKKEKRGPSAFRRLMDSPAAAAVISAVVAFTVLFLIVRAGHNAPVNPGPTPAGRDTLPVTETEAAESEPLSETTPEARTEAPTEPQTAVPGQDVHMGIIGGADAPTLHFILREILTDLLPALLVVGTAAAGIVLLLRSGRKKQPDAVPAPQDPPTRAQKVLITVLAALFLLFLPYLLRLQIETVGMSGYFMSLVSSGYVTDGLFAALKLLKPIGAMLPSLAACAAGLVFAVLGAVLTWTGRLDRRRASTFSGIAGGLACFAAMWFPRLYLILISANAKWWENDLLTLPAYAYWQNWRAFGFIGPRDGVNVSLLTDGTAYEYVHPVMLGLLILTAAVVVLLSLIAGRKNVPTADDCRRTSRVLTLLTSVAAGVSGAVSLYGIFIILFGRLIGSLLFSVAGYDLTILDTDTVSCIAALLLILALAAASLVTVLIAAVRLKKGRPTKRSDVVLTAATVVLQLFLWLFVESVLRDNFEGRAMLRELFAGAGVLTSAVQCLLPFAIAAACALAVMLVRRLKTAETTGEPEKGR